MTNVIVSIEAQERRRVDHAAFYRMIWRWHFYAGLFCLPFVAILALSGAVYLFKPQVDAYFDRPYTNMTLSGAPRSLDDQVGAALAAVPGSRIKGVELPEDANDAARVSVIDETGREQRILVRPDTLQILAVQDEKWRLSSLMHDIHGSMLLGTPGAIVLELAGAWAIVMIITGLYMWWPSGGGLAGVLYPRSGRPFLRDLHAVAGFYVSFFALFLLITGLPWTVVWGAGFKMVRSAAPPQQARMGWTTGPASERAQRMAAYNSAPPAADEHAEHRDHAGMQHVGASLRLGGFDRIAQLVRPEHLAGPVILTPPSPKNPNWQARSATQNRPQQQTLSFDPASFTLVKREDFSGKPMIDKVVGVGIAAHEGHLFGVTNQLLGLFTALSFLTLVVSSLLMWLRRRRAGVLGAPPALAEPPRLAPALVLLIVLLSLFLPTLGMSLVAVFCFEAAARRFSPGIAAWLGLTPCAAPS